MPGTRSWSRCRAGAMCPRWPAAAAAPSPAAGTAPGRCRCPIGTPRVRCAAGAAARNPRCAVPDADPTRSARSSSAHAEPQRNSAGHSPAPPSSPPAATPSCPRCRAIRRWLSPRRAPNRWPRAATAPRCCWTPGHCWVVRTCVRPRTRCAAGWRPATLVRSRGDGGVVAVVAESAVPTVQALIRWDPVGHAEAELDARAEVGLPPAVHMAAVDGAPDAVAALLETAELPDSAELLGPVDLPSGARRAPGHSGRQSRSAGCSCGCPAQRGWNWPRRCGGPPGCSARGTISSRFGCKSTRCT